jgi:hypothetical protein
MKREYACTEQVADDYSISPSSCNAIQTKNAAAWTCIYFQKLVQDQPNQVLIIKRCNSRTWTRQTKSKDTLNENIHTWLQFWQGAKWLFRKRLIEMKIRWGDEHHIWVIFWKIYLRDLNPMEASVDWMTCTDPSENDPPLEPNKYDGLQRPTYCTNLSGTPGYGFLPKWAKRSHPFPAKLTDWVWLTESAFQSWGKTCIVINNR